MENTPGMDSWSEGKDMLTDGALDAESYELVRSVVGDGFLVADTEWLGSCDLEGAEELEEALEEADSEPLASRDAYEMSTVSLRGVTLVQIADEAVTAWAVPRSAAHKIFPAAKIPK